MKTWIKRTLIGLTGSTLLLGSLAGCAWRGHRDNWGSGENITEMRGKAIERISSKLELNDSQKQKLEVLADELLAQRTAFRGQGANPQTEFSAVIEGSTFDRPRAQALLDQKTRAVQTNGPKVIAALADFFDSLNAEQQQQVRERLAKRGRRGWGHRG